MRIRCFNNFKGISARGSKLGTVFLLAVFTCCLFFTPLTSAVEISPPTQIILTWTTDPATSQTITWLMPGNLPVQVQYIMANEYYGNFDLAQQVNVNGTVFTNTNYRYTVNLTGLAPDTKYMYRVGSEGVWSEPLSFTTAADTEKFTFLYLGDIQSGYTEWGNMVDSLYQEYPEIKFSLLGGDLTDKSSDENEWGQFLDGATDVFSLIPVMPTLGNHDGYMYLKFFALPNNGPEGLQQEFYSFDYGNAHFVVLNSSNNTNSTVKQWLQADLQNTTKNWKFAIFHHPAYPAFEDYKTIDESICQNWVPILEDNGVDMVFVGHQHEYMRTYPIYQGQIQSDPQTYGIVYVMGNSGTKVYAAGADFPYIDCEETGSNYQVIDIDGNVLTLTSKKANGELIESYTINKTPVQPATPKYYIIPEQDVIYTIGVTPDGIKTMTLNADQTGFKYFTVSIEPVKEHKGEETVVFVHLRNGFQMELTAGVADFDVVNNAKAGFNVNPGDVIKIFIVDDLSNAIDYNPVVLH